MKDRETYSYVKKGNMTKARKTVNGGTNGLDEVNSSYKNWVKAFKACGVQENQGGHLLASSDQIRGARGSSNANEYKAIGGEGLPNLASSSKSKIQNGQNKDNNSSDYASNGIDSKFETNQSNFSQNKTKGTAQESGHVELYQILKPSFNDLEPLLS
jgi:hypothetical protein